MLVMDTKHINDEQNEVDLKDPDLKDLADDDGIEYGDEKDVDEDEDGEEEDEDEKLDEEEEDEGL